MYNHVDDSRVTLETGQSGTTGTHQRHLPLGGRTRTRTEHDVAGITCLSSLGLGPASGGHVSVRRKLQPGSQRHHNAGGCQGATCEELRHNDCRQRLLPPHVHRRVRYSEVDADEQRLAAGAMWINESATWNPADYGGVSYVNPDPDKAWRPRLTMKDLKPIGEDYVVIVSVRTSLTMWYTASRLSVR